MSESWVERPDEVWDCRPEALSRGDCVYPHGPGGVPVKVLALTAANERIPFPFHINFKTGRVGHYKTRVNERGHEVVEHMLDPATGKKTPVEEWLDVPGVKVIPMPVDMVRALEERALARKGYRREPDGTISTGHPIADE